MAKKNRKKQAPGELIYGVHSLIEALKAKKRKLISVYTTKPTPKQWPVIERLLPSYPVAIQYVSRDVLTNMCGTNEHQGIVAWVQSFPFRKKPFTSKEYPFLVLLDSIQDPRNVGAILRSAFCAGASGAILTTKNSAPLNAVAIKSSAGLSEHLEIQLVTTSQEALQVLSEAGYTNYLAMLGGEDVRDLDLAIPSCMVIGNEGAGLSKSLQRFGTAVTLPQKMADSSYNASVAAGILLFMMGTKHKLI